MDVRLNRLGLLKSLHEAMNRVADLSRLALEALRPDVHLVALVGWCW